MPGHYATEEKDAITEREAHWNDSGAKLTEAAAGGQAKNANRRIIGELSKWKIKPLIGDVL